MLIPEAGVWVFGVFILALRLSHEASSLQTHDLGSTCWRHLVVCLSISLCGKLTARLAPSVTPLNHVRYRSLLELGEKRKGMLEKSCKKFMLFREANELQQWINEKEAALTSEEVGADLEQVEVLQKKFDDFQKVGEVLLRAAKLFKALVLLMFFQITRTKITWIIFHHL